MKERGEIGRLYEAMVFAAYLVEQYGDAYAPILARMEEEWSAVLKADTPQARARRILNAHTVEGGLNAIR